MVCKQLTAYLVAHNLCVPVHSAYRPNDSTEIALLKVVNDLLLDNGNAVVLALPDQSAAFDTVDPSILINGISSLFGLSDTICSLRRRRQSVCIEVSSSVEIRLLIWSSTGFCNGAYFIYTVQHPQSLNLEET